MKGGAFRFDLSPSFDFETRIPVKKLGDAIGAFVKIDKTKRCLFFNPNAQGYVGDKRAKAIANTMLSDVRIDPEEAVRLVNETISPNAAVKLLKKGKKSTFAVEAEDSNVPGQAVEAELARLVKKFVPTRPPNDLLIKIQVRFGKIFVNPGFESCREVKDVQKLFLQSKPYHSFATEVDITETDLFSDQPLHELIYSMKVVHQGQPYHASLVSDGKNLRVSMVSCNEKPVFRVDVLNAAKYDIRVQMQVETLLHDGPVVDAMDEFASTARFNEEFLELPIRELSNGVTVLHIRRKDRFSYSFPDLDSVWDFSSVTSWEPENTIKQLKHRKEVELSSRLFSQFGQPETRAKEATSPQVDWVKILSEAWGMAASFE